ncbi:MAG: ATP-binding protein [Bdellovibrionota bacterium]
MFESPNRFIGRESETRRLEGFISEVASGGSGVLVIEAPSGGGKTLFLQKSLAEISQTHIEVISGQGVQMSAMTPGYILSGLSKYLLNSDQWSKPLREHIQYYFEDITRIFPGISLLRGDSESVQDSTVGGLNFFALNRIATCLAKIFSMIATENRPVLLVLDDFQWADELSKQTLKMWLESEKSLSSHFGVIVCCRKENSEQLSYLKKDLLNDHIELRPFTVGETSEYLQKFNLAANPHQVESIVSLTAGNPFAIHFLATDMSVQNQDLAQPTATLAATISRHFFALNKMQQLLLLHLAVFAKSAAISDLAIIANIAYDEAYTELVSADLRILVDITGPYLSEVRFNHDKIREALISQLNPASLLKFHQLIVGFLEKQSKPDLFKLAFHCAQASDSAKAIKYSLQAAEEAFSSASYDLAIQNFQIALSFILTKDQRRADILARLGEAYLLIGKYDSSSQIFNEAIACCEIKILSSEYTGKLGEIQFKQGNIATATHLTEKALTLLQVPIPKTKLVTCLFLFQEVVIQAWHTLFLKSGPRPQISGKAALAARLLSRLAYCYWFGKGAIYCGWAHIKELNAVERFADSLEKAQAYSEHAPVMTMIPWFERGINYSYQSMKIRESLNSRWGVGQSKGFLGTSLYGSSRFQEAEQVCSEAYDILVKEGDMWEANTAGWHVAIALYRQGRLKEAISHSQKIFNSGKSLNDNQSAAICLGIIGKASDGQSVDINEIERIERLQLTDAHALAELSIAKATYLASHKKFDEALLAIEDAKNKVNIQGLRQEYVTPLWPWSATMLRLKIQQTFLTPAEAAKSFKLLKKFTRQSLFKARFYKNNLPHALREEAYRLFYIDQKKRAMATLNKSLEVAVQQKAQWEAINSYELWKVWGKDLPDHVHRKMAFEIDKIIDADNFILPEVSQHNNTEKSVGYFLNEISHIKTPRDGLEKLYRFTSHLSSLRRSVGVVEYFSNNTSHDFLPVLETSGQSYKSLTMFFEESLHLRDAIFVKQRDRETIVVLPIRRQTNTYGFVYIICADELSYAEFVEESGQIETLVRLVTSAIEQRQQHTQIQLLNQDLALRIRNAINLTEQKNVELVEAEKQAQLASKAKSEFLANMSHEIRTPLNGVMGTISLLKSTQLTKDQFTFLEALESSSENLFRIVNDILDLTKIEAGRQTLQNETMWVSDLVLQCCDLYRASADKKNILLQHDIAKLENIKVNGDALRIRQILANLITNAIKFTDDGSVLIRATNKISADHVKYRLEVIDTGCGIVEGDYQKLFQNFSQLDGSSKKKAAGTGLGLSICHKLVELMSGEIGLSSEKGKGSTFWFEITLKRELEQAPKATLVKEELNLKWSKLKVLVAEDNQVNQMIIRKMLEGLNCEVTITENGEKFIEKIKTEDYDLAFLDCQMPVVDGFDACRRLRADHIQTPPIIALTAYALESDRQRCFDAGMDDYLSKPVKVDVIKSMMEKWHAKKTKTI